MGLMVSQLPVQRYAATHSSCCYIVAVMIFVVFQTASYAASVLASQLNIVVIASYMYLAMHIIVIIIVIVIAIIEWLSIPYIFPYTAIRIHCHTHSHIIPLCLHACGFVLCAPHPATIILASQLSFEHLNDVAVTGYNQAFPVQPITTLGCTGKARFG